jgi:hypothetical protein
MVVDMLIKLMEYKYSERSEVNREVLTPIKAHFALIVMYCTEQN